MTTPTSEHKLLEKLVGNWQGRETMSPAPWDPTGGPAVGRVNNKVSLDGLAVVQEDEQERNGGISFRGHGVFHYDMNEKDYVMHWWDSMGMGSQVFRGNFVDDVLAMVSSSPMGHTKCTFDVKEPGRYAFVMEVSQDGSNWMTAMTGDYRPAAKAKAAGGAKKAAAKPAKKTKTKMKAAAKKKPAAMAKKASPKARKAATKKKK